MTNKRRNDSSAAAGLSGLELIILGLFFASGASALVYEVVWARLLTYTFGGSAFAIATVLAAYMGGLALGSLWFGERIDRRGHPLLIYGVLEGIIGVWALALPFILEALDGLYAGIYRSTNMGSYPLSFLRFILCFLLLLVPTTMMGGTLPILGKLLIRNWKGLGARAGLLYGINTLGAVVGVFSAGFFLVPTLGLSGATYLAVLVNFGITAAAVLISRRIPFLRQPEPGDQPAAGTPPPRKGFAIPRDPVKRAVLLVYAASGFAALSYEVAWTKVLSMILGTTTYAFASMLTTFLLGLALGAFLFGRLADRFGKPEGLLVTVQLLIPLFALATIPILQALPQIWVDAFPSLEGSWVRLEAFRFLLAAATMIVPAILMGGTFPLVTRVYVDRASVGRSLGTLYASNTLGAILGSFLTGFILIPWIGRQNSILAATLINLIAAGVLLWTVRPRSLPQAYRWTTAIVVLAMVPMAALAVRPWNKIVMSSGAYYYPKDLGASDSIEEHLKDARLLFYKEATDASISVWRIQHVTSLRMNGKNDASSHGDMRTQKLIAHLPLIYDRDAGQSAALIGLASGITAGSMLTYPLDHLDVIELVEGVDEAATYFNDYNYNCLEDPRFNLIVNDGRNQLKLSDKTYDIIVSEPTNAWIAGVGALFTQEFFELTRDRLSPGGIAALWVHIYHMKESEIKAVLATFNEVFPHLDVWMGNRGDLILVGSNDPLSWDWAYYGEVFRARPGEDLKSCGILSPEALFSFYVSDKDGLEAYIGDFEKRVTDDNLLLEYGIPRHMFATEGDANASDLVPYYSPPARRLTGAPESVQAETRLYQEAHGDALKAYFGTHTSGKSPRQIYTDVLSRAPNEILAREVLSKDFNERGITRLQAGQHEEASRLFREALAIASREEAALAWNNLGYIAFLEGRLDSAEAAWRRSVKAEPMLANPSLNLGMVAASRNDYAAAARHFENVVAIDGKNSAALNNAAYNLIRAGGDPDRALRLATRAVELNKAPEHLDTLGYVLIQRNEYGEAEAVLREAVTLNSAYYEAWLNLGRAQKGLGLGREARRSFQLVVDSAQDEDLIRQARSFLQSL